MAQGITLPITLQIENLQSIVSTMKGQLSNLKVDSSGYKKLAGIITDIERRIEKLQVSSSKPITDASQFTEMESSVKKLEDDLVKIQIEAGKIKFGDVSLSPEQQSRLAEFNEKIHEIDAALKQAKESAKNIFLESDVGKAWAELHPEAITQSFSQITRAITQEVSKQKQQLDEARAAYAEYQTSQRQTTNLNSFMKKGHLLDSQTMGQDLYNSIFSQDGKRFKNGGRGLLSSWLQEQFSIDKSTADALVAESASKVRDAFSKAGGEVEGILKSEQSRLRASMRDRRAETNNGATLRADIQQKEASYNQATNTQNGLVQANDQMRQSADALTESLERTKQSKAAWQQEVAKGISPALTEGANQARDGLRGLSGTLEDGKEKLASFDAASSKLQGLSNFVNRYLGAYAIIRKVSTAIKNAFNNIKELDKTITSIAVVTNMSQKDLWGKIGEYTSMAQDYGVATKDVYSVSQIFYQQGLQTSQVMAMTTESLKMAKIAGIDYSTAANAMTVAVRAFKLEMSEAQSVTDTYSALAAKFAVSSSEIANAMEKTASSAASVGMSVQSTSAFISVMTQTTRESAQNIGSALKSIISRYGEMKASPSKLIDVDGEQVAFNKVDTALASVGISIKDASGQFRNFDDVIMELAGKWDTLDTNTQRYIATIMAGNRQQSRFIALVSNYDELNRAMDTANNAENASIVQVAKTMDSLESKANQVKNAFSQLYLDLHIEDGLKGAYDWLTRVLKTVGKLGTAFGALPTLANIFGLGTGMKSIFKNSSALIQAQKYKVNTTEAESDIRRVREEASKDINTKWNIQADTSQLQGMQAQLEAQMTATSQTIGTRIMEINPNLATNAASISADAIAMAQKGLLADSTARAQFLETKGIRQGTAEYTEIDTLLQSLSGLASSAEQVGTSLKTLENATQGATNSEEQQTQANQQGAEATEQKTSAETSARITIEQSKYSKGEEITSSSELAKAKGLEAQAAYRVIDANTGEEIAGKQLILTKDQEGNTVLQLISAGSELPEATYAVTDAQKGATTGAEELARATKDAAGGVKQLPRGRTDKIKDDSSTGLSWKSWGKGNALKYAGIATGLTRMAGTAVTAIGAAHQDKSTDTVETSKLLTGAGNGLSMAGTGASMLMGLGPWGAAVGAIGGFLLGGLGAIIDGAKMTLEEQLALQQEESKKASEESLKSQAKATELDSNIDNLKKLQKAMYNSADDMTAYQDAMANMASQYPELISSYDSAGNAIIDLNQAEVLLAETRAEASHAANEAAKAEAKVRQTKIATLKEAQGSLENTQNSVDSTFIKDQNGNIHAIDQSGRYGWGDLIYTLRQQNADFDENNLTSVLEAVLATNIDPNNGYASEVIQYWKSFAENSTIDKENGSVSLGNFEKTFEYDSNIKKANETLKNRASDLNITKTAEVNDNVAYIYGFMGWNKTIELTAERVKEFEEKLSQRVSGYEKTVATLDNALPAIDAQESLDSALLNKEVSKASKISTSKVAAQLIAGTLESVAKDNNLTAGEWSRTEDTKLASEYNTVKTSATESVVNWLTSLSDDALDTTLEILGNMTQYTSIDSMLKTMGYSDESKFIESLQKSGVSEDQANELISGWQESFINANQANRDRILKTIYQYDENGNRVAGQLNKDMTGLNKLNYTDNIEKIYDNNGKWVANRPIVSRNQAKDIAYRFAVTNEDGSSQIISQYADFFTSQLLEVNKLADEGFLNTAQVRLDALDAFSSSLAQMTDKQQTDLFSILNIVDFTDFDTIDKAIASIQSYAKENNIDLDLDGPFKQLYDTLSEASQNLLFNVNTLAESLTESISQASKEVDSIITSNKSGIAFSQAIEQFSDLQAQFENLGNFGEVFNYDAALGNYVYTAEGLQKAIQAKQQQLANQAQQLSDTAKIYTDTISRHNQTTFKLKDTDFETKDTLMEALNGQADFTGLEQNVKSAYEQLIDSYLAQHEAGQRSVTGFWDHVQEQIKANNDMAQDALLLEKEYKKNIKNQYYQSIDWSKLALGTDFSGTNQMLMDSLVLELNKYSREITNDDGTVIRQLKQQYENTVLTWQEVLDEYLNETYGNDTNAKEAARVAIEGQIKQQKSQSISTAITEVLAGAGSALSEGSAAILAASGQLNGLVDESGVLKAADICVQTALDFFNSMKNEFTTTAERNKAYLEIINASFAPAQATKTLLSSGNKLDFSTIESTFTGMGLNLDDYWDAQNKKWKAKVKPNIDKQGNVIGPPEQGLEGIFETDIFGNTTIRNWDDYVEWIAGKRGISVDEIKNSPGYAKMRQTYIDSVIGSNEEEDPNKAILKSLSALSSAKVGTEVNVESLTGLSDELKQKLDVDGNGIYEVVSEVERDNIIMAIDAATLESEEAKRELQTLQKNITKKRNKFAGLKGIAGERVSEDAAKAFVESMGVEDATEEIINEQMSIRGYIYNSFTDEWMATNDSIIYLQNRLKQLSTSLDGQDHTQEIKELEATIKNLEDTLGNKKTNVFRDLLSNYTNVTPEQIAAFETQFKNIDVDKFTHDVNGQKELDVTALLAAYPELASIIDASLTEEMSQIIDDRLGYITEATSLIVSGTTSQADMSSFVTKYNKAMGTNLSQKNLFSYDDVLDSFTLKPEYLSAYIETQKKELEGLGWKPEDIEQYVKDNTIKQFAAEIDIDSFLDSTDRGEGSKSRDKLIKQIENLNISNLNLDQIPEEEQEEALAWAKKKAEDTVAVLEAGGQAAVDAAKKIAEDAETELSPEDIEKYYYSALTRLQDYSDAIGELTLGSYVADSGLREILASVGAVDENGLVSSVEKMANAYKAIYNQMKSTAGRTQTDLNKVYAQFLTAGEQDEIDVVEFLGDAVSMTYETLGEFLGKRGQSLEKWLKKNQDKYEKIGAGKIRITNFQAMAKDLGLEFGSEEYFSALHDYNEKLIKQEEDRKQLFKDFGTALTESKGGDKVDVTDLMNELDKVQTESEEDFLDEAAEQIKKEDASRRKISKERIKNTSKSNNKVKEYDNKSFEEQRRARAKQLAEKAAKERKEQMLKQINEFGGTIENGILTLSEDANILGIAKTIEEVASQAGNELAHDTIVLADTVANIIKSYTEAINKGIKGGLTNEESYDLQNTAKSLGIKDLSFTKTAEGLKLSQTSAIQLYQKLKQIDVLQGQLVFDELNSSLQETNEHFASVTSITARIAELQEKIASADEKVSSARLEQYEAELDIAKEILLVRSTSEDESFNFMSNNIPGVQNNPINYFNNWADAIQKLKAAMKTTSKTSDGKSHTGLIDYQDWYNIITELNNLAGRMQDGMSLGEDIEGNAIKLDGSLESAAKLIEKGASALTVDSTGKIKVALGDIGIDFEAGSGEMSDGIDAGIKEIANSQIKMLDGMIRLLEVIVAMEQLGDVTGGDHTIDFTDFFIDIGDGFAKLADNDQITEWVKYLLNLNDKENDLYKALDQIKINNESLRTLLTKSQEGKITIEDAQALTSVLDSMWKMYESGEWDTKEIYDGLAKVAEQSGLGGELTIDIDDTTLIIRGGKITQIDWSDNNTQKVLEDWKADQKGDKKELIEEIQKYHAGEPVTGTLEYVLRLEKKLTITEAGDYIVDINGQRTNLGQLSGDALKNVEHWIALTDLTGQDFPEDIDITKEPATITMNTKITGKSQYTVTYDESGAHYTDGEEHEGNTFNDLALSWWNDQKDQQLQDFSTDIDAKKEAYWHFGQSVKTEIEVTVGEETDSVLKNPGEAREKFKTALESGTWKKDLDFNEQGEATVEIGDAQFTVSAAEFATPDGKPDTSKIEAWARENLLGLDIGLSETIAEGVKQALTDIPSEPAKEAAEAAEDAAQKAAAAQEAAKEAKDKFDELVTATSNVPDIDVETASAASKIESLQLSWDNWTPRTKLVQVKGNFPTRSDAKGNVGNAKAQGTLMGELGPELVVQNGRYFIAGQAGAEFVDLASDAIVFNHLQTEQLLKNGMSAQRGHAVTNERVAVAYAKGSRDPNKIFTQGIDYDGKHIQMYALGQGVDKIINDLSDTTTITLGIRAEKAIDEYEFFKEKLSQDKVPIDIDTTNAEKTAQTFSTEVMTIYGESYKFDLTKDEVKDMFDELQETSDDFSITLKTDLAPQVTTKHSSKIGGYANAKGTLMGELGPELVVSNGRYFVVGQNGPEMIDLADDAIVFNHLQTESLLKRGMSTGRGTAVTNEYNAVAFAKGNANGGPAMASASSVLAVLRQLRAEWQSLAGLSVKDLAGKGGGGGGSDNKSFLQDLEKWYNWLQKIARLEQQITSEETKRSKLASDFNVNGKAYYESQKETLKYLKDEADTYESLYKAQQEYFNERRDYFASKNAPFNSLYTFDEYGQLKYQKGAFEKLSYLMGTDEYGKPNLTAEEQYNYVIGTLGIDEELLKYNDSGELIDQSDYTAKMELFWNQIEADKEEMQSLHDSIQDYENKMLEAQQKQNEIMKEIEDNQIDVEERVLKAEEDRRQRIIDEMQDVKDAIEKGNQALIDGLTESLEKERSMYENQQNEQELTRLQRQLSILQRSGGSAAQISELQSQIDERSQEAYFDKQQEQIDAIQDASDKQIEKLQEQIDIETEAFEYEKAQGLLWDKVYDVMGRSSEEILDFITKEDSDYWSKSLTGFAQESREALFAAEQWKAYAEDAGSIEALTKKIADELTAEKTAEETTSEDTGDGYEWQQTDGRWWYGKDNENYVKDDWRQIDGSWYHFDKSGWMDANKWVKDGEKWYYVDEHGAMVTGEQTIDGKKYNFGDNGEWIEDTNQGSQPAVTEEGETKPKGYEQEGKYIVSYEAYGKKYTHMYSDLDAAEQAFAVFKNNPMFTHLSKTGFKQGGLADFTGPAWLDGTKTKPESVLTAKQTEILRNDILGNSHNSLMNLLLDFRDAYEGIGVNATSSTNNNAIIIEHAEVNMKVEQLSNDYDAARAGDAVMKQMLNIARKSAANNRIGR